MAYPLATTAGKWLLRHKTVVKRNVLDSCVRHCTSLEQLHGFHLEGAGEECMFLCAVIVQV